MKYSSLKILCLCLLLALIVGTCMPGYAAGNKPALITGSGTWLEGERFSGSVSEEELQTWVIGLQ